MYNDDDDNDDDDDDDDDDDLLFFITADRFARIINFDGGKLTVDK